MRGLISHLRDRAVCAGAPHYALCCTSLQQGRKTLPQTRPVQRRVVIWCPIAHKAGLGMGARGEGDRPIASSPPSSSVRVLCGIGSVPLPCVCVCVTLVACVPFVCLCRPRIHSRTLRVRGLAVQVAEWIHGRCGGCCVVSRPRTGEGPMGVEPGRRSSARNGTERERWSTAVVSPDPSRGRGLWVLNPGTTAINH